MATETDIAQRLHDCLCKIRPLQSNQRNRNRLLNGIEQKLVTTVPASDDPYSHLNEIISYAWSWGRVNGKYALDIVIGNAIQLVKGTDLERKLKDLKLELEKTWKNHINVVVFAMTLKQAEELDSERRHSPSDDNYRKWEKLKSTLQKHKINNMLSSYGENIDDWTPLITDVPKPPSIRNIIQEIVDKRNKESVDIQFLSSDFFSKDQDKKNKARSLFAYFGGVLIIDVISMYHVNLRNDFLASGAASINNPISMAVVSPINKNLLELNLLLEKEIYVPCLWDALKRFDTVYDPYYNFNTGDIRGLQHWLHSILLEYRAKPNPKGIAMFEERMGKSNPDIMSYISGVN